jgi:heme exporter protein C
VPAHTGSRATRALGVLVLAGLGLLLLLALVLSPADATQGDVVRVMYVHVPSAIAAYLAFGVTALGSALYLWKRSQFWDLAAGASAEIGVLFTALTLLTGSLWGRPTWGVYWVWDARLTSTALLLVLFVGYLAVRNLPGERHVRAKRAAIAGLVAFVDVPLVHYSVDWWRSLHQPATLTRLDPTIEGLMLFTLMTGIVVFLGLYLWLVIHRFRIEYLREQLDASGLDAALAERRAEAAAGDHPPLAQPVGAGVAAGTTAARLEREGGRS